MSDAVSLFSFAKGLASITCSFLVSLSWGRTTPMLLASVPKINDLLKFGEARMGAEQSC